MIAFFDFDGTLIDKESGVIVALPCIRRGVIPKRLAARLVGTYLLSKTGLRTRAQAQLAGFACYAGRSLDALRGLMQELYDQHVRAHVSPVMRDRINHHRERGDHLVILTASAFFFAEPIGRDLGFDRVVGTQVVFRDGVCTGQVEGAILDGQAKLEAARTVAADRGAALSACTFYTDHPADLPLLEAVGTPVAVGKRRDMGAIAHTRGWQRLPYQESARR